MANLLSPGVQYNEYDYTTSNPGISSKVAGHAGMFRWGDINVPISISSQTELVKKFGRPTDYNFESFYTAYNFLSSYGNNMTLVRADSTNLKNAVDIKSGSVTNINITSAGSNYSSVPTIVIGSPQTVGGIQATATAVLSGGGVTSIPITNGGTGYTTATITLSAPQRAGGTQAVATATLSSGVITSITITTAGTGYTSAPTATVTGNGSGAILGTPVISTSSIFAVTITNAGSGYTATPSVTITGNATLTATILQAGVKIKNKPHYLSTFSNGEGVFGQVSAKCAGVMGNSIRVIMVDSATYSSLDTTSKGILRKVPSTSAYVSNLGGSNDELHILVIDALGYWTGTAGTILETYEFLSKAYGAKAFNGTSNYYKDVLNDRSEYVYWMDFPTGVTNWGVSPENIAFDSMSVKLDSTLSGGLDDFNSTEGQLLDAWDIFKDKQLIDVSFLPVGGSSASVTSYIINSISEYRRDAITCFSAKDANGNIVIGTDSDLANDMVTYSNTISDSSFAFCDSGYKLQYDRFNNRERYIPLNGDVVGIMALSIQRTNEWTSPAGFNRGILRSPFIKLAYNPNETARDILYQSSINPVFTDTDGITLLYGDKTFQSRPSATDRYGVRGLIIYLSKLSSRLAKYYLFENNTDSTRRRLLASLEPIYRDVTAQGGLEAYKLVCDKTNNTDAVIRSNSGVVDIYIKPTRSINFLYLNINVVDGVASFTETVI